MDKLPPHFREKWSRLSLVTDPTDQSFAKIVGEGSNLSDNPELGQTFDYANGALISYGSNTAPFLIYGDIYNYWKSMGSLTSGFGHPIADPQFLSDGSICSIFEGGHVHRPPGGSNIGPEMVHPDECEAPIKPAIPPPLARGSRNWPPAFRQKWSSLAIQRDPFGKQLVGLIGSTDAWPHTWPGLTDNDNGGRLLWFTTGRLVSYDFRTPPFLIYGKIFDLWNDLGGIKSGLGHPLADPQILDDGSLCSIFEGGHVHQTGTMSAEIFPANECTAPNQPTVPAAVAKASTYWPQQFRKKWTALSVECEPNGKQFVSLLGPTDTWPHTWPGLTDNPNGGKTLHFRNGKLISSTYQSPPFLFYDKIFTLWDGLGGLDSGFGFPLTDPQILDDGTICNIFEGGHIHRIGTRDAEVVPADECTAEHKPVATGAALNVSPHWPKHFRIKWSLLAPQCDPSGKQLCGLLGPADCWPYSWPGLTDNEDGGKMLHFRNGRLISWDNQTPPILVYGNIFNVWNNLGGLKSDFKYPLADPQFLPDESICSVFEGGHIHQPRGAKDADVFPASDCMAPYQPTSRASVIGLPSVQAVVPPPAPPPAQDVKASYIPPNPPVYTPTSADHSSASQTFHPYPPPQAVQPEYQPLVQASQPPTQEVQPPPQPPVEPPTEEPLSPAPTAEPPRQPPYPVYHSPTEISQSPTQPAYPQYHTQAPQHGAQRHRVLEDAVSIVGRGIRNLGTGINRVADTIEKYNH